MELLILLVRRQGELVTREEIATQLWGDGVFVDTDHSINTAVRKVRVALRDDPEKPRFIETVVGKGYRFAAPVTCNGDSRPEQPALTATVEAVPAAPPAAPAKAGSRRLKLVSAAIVVALVVVAGFLVRSRQGVAKPSAIRSIAVLPLKNLSGDPVQEYFADGMTDELIGRLSTIRDLRVISRTSVMRFKDTRLSVPEIAKMLNVDAVVEGSVIRDAGRVRVNAELIRGATDAHVWSESYERDLSDTIALQGEIADSLASKVQVTVTGEEHARLVAARHVAPDVYESYLKGRLGRTDSKADLERNVAYFEDAIAKDASFAPAYVGLAESYDDLGTIFVGAPPNQTRERVVSAAKQALQLDPELADAHTLLARVYQERWQWADAEAEYKRALALQPNNASAHNEYASWLACQGRTDEALQWAQRGRELDPVAFSGSDIAWILILQRHYDQAIRELQAVLSVTPSDANALWNLGFALIENGQPSEAIAPLEKAVALTGRGPGAVGLLAAAYARAGRRTEAINLIAELQHRSRTAYVPAGAFINPYLALGDYDRAFAWMERAYQEQSNILQFLKVHPFFDPLRTDPRFINLLHRVGLN